MSADHIDQPGNPQEGYDHHEAKAGMVGLWSAATVLVLVACVVAMYWLYMIGTGVEYEENVGKPLWQIAQDTKAREDEQLYHYGYIEKEKGLVRIPIDRAMQLIAEEYKQGKVGYSTKSYTVRPEPDGGAQGGGFIITALEAKPASPAAEPLKK